MTLVPSIVLVVLFVCDPYGLSASSILVNLMKSIIPAKITVLGMSC